MTDLASPERHIANQPDRADDSRLMKVRQGIRGWSTTPIAMVSHLQIRLGERPSCWSRPWMCWT